MILIGQYDSPFVRRVGVALRLYGLDYAHRPWSTFGDAEQLAEFNPLRRVPTLVLDDGEVLIESGAILDHLDEIAAGPPLLARSGRDRRAALKICAIGSGLADKAVTLVYERVLHETTSPLWVGRCQTQIAAVLDALEAARGSTPFWFGDRINHADIMVACALRFLREAHATLFDPARWPKLAAHAQTCEALGAFQAVTQVFDPPK